MAGALALVAPAGTAEGQRLPASEGGAAADTASTDTPRAVSVTLLRPVPRPSRGREVARWTAAGALVAGALLLDRPLDGAIPDGGGTRWEGASDALNPLGNPRYSLPLLAGAWAAGKVADRPALSDGAAHVLAGLLVAGAANGGLKWAVGRERPATTSDPYRFRPFNGSNRFQAFPSGHATVAFALAAGVSEEARTPWVTVATYGAAGAVAWSRVYEDKHWTSDVVAGSLVGIVAGRGTVAYLHRRAERRADEAGGSAGSGARVSLLPGGVAVSLPAP